MLKPIRNPSGDATSALLTGRTTAPGRPGGRACRRSLPKGWSRHRRCRAPRRASASCRSRRVGRNGPSWSRAMSRYMGCPRGQRSTRSMSSGVQVAVPLTEGTETGHPRLHRFQAALHELVAAGSPASLDLGGGRRTGQVDGVVARRRQTVVQSGRRERVEGERVRDVGHVDDVVGGRVHVEAVTGDRLLRARPPTGAVELFHHDHVPAGLGEIAGCYQAVVTGAHHDVDTARHRAGHVRLMNRRSTSAGS